MGRRGKLGLAAGAGVVCLTVAAAATVWYADQRSDDASETSGAVDIDDEYAGANTTLAGFPDPRTWPRVEIGRLGTIAMPVTSVEPVEAPGAVPLGQRESIDTWSGLTSVGIEIAAYTYRLPCPISRQRVHAVLRREARGVWNGIGGTVTWQDPDPMDGLPGQQQVTVVESDALPAGVGYAHQVATRRHVAAFFVTGPRLHADLVRSTYENVVETFSRSSRLGGSNAGCAAV